MQKPISKSLTLFILVTIALGAFGIMSNPSRSVSAQSGTAAATAASTRIPISLKSSAQVSMVARLGRGTINQVVWSPDGKTLALAGGIGVWLYAAGALD